MIMSITRIINLNNTKLCFFATYSGVCG